MSHFARGVFGGSSRILGGVFDIASGVLHVLARRLRECGRDTERSSDADYCKYGFHAGAAACRLPMASALPRGE